MLVDALLAHARHIPNDPAIIDETGSYTFSRVGASAIGLSMYLAMQTSRPAVALMLPSSAGFVASFYAALLAGKAVVPVNFLLGEREIAHVLRDSGVDTVITIPQLAPRLAGSGLNVIDITVLPRPTPERAAQLLASPPPLPAKSADDLAVLMYTSGTSGLPKGVELTYGNLQSDVDACIEVAQLKQRHKFLGVIPLFHAFGMTAMMIAPIQLGSTCIYMARFSPVAAVNAIREHGISLLFAVPSMLAAIARLKDATPEDFKAIYALISGGEPLPAAIRDAFKNRFNLTLYEGFGLTETSPVVSMNTPQVHRQGSVGQLVPGAQARIVDDQGNALGPNQPGEVWLKGPMIMKGYHNLPAETAAALTPDGYFKTGDLGKLDDDGFLYITGRKKELIIVAGEKAVPREIEEALLRHPAVAEAAVVGRKDASRGEVVVAFLIPKEGEDPAPEQLRETCRAAGLPQWKIPRDFYFEKELPRSPTGKVLKRILSERVNSSA